MAGKGARRRTIRPPALPRMPHVPVFPKGPKFLQQQQGTDRVSGPGAPPPGFITPTNSISEWVIYWALAKVIGFPADPRVGPFVGWPGLWTYQSPFEGGRAAGGGQVIDFVVFGPAGVVGATAIRIQTERYHILTDSAKQMTDFILAQRLAGIFRVVDLYEQDYIRDQSGQAAIVTLKQGLFGGAASSPLRAGRAHRIKAA
jgi:hypothetical protein